MTNINEQDTQPRARYAKPNAPKGDFAAGERTVPASTTVGDFASGEHELPISTVAGDFASSDHTPPPAPDNRADQPTPATTVSALDHKD